MGEKKTHESGRQSTTDQQVLAVLMAVSTLIHDCPIHELAASF